MNVVEEAQSRMNVLQQDQYVRCRRSTIKDECATEEAQSNRMCYSKSKMNEYREAQSRMNRLQKEAQSRMNVLQQDQDVCATEKRNEQ